MAIDGQHLELYLSLQIDEDFAMMQATTGSVSRVSHVEPVEACHTRAPVPCHTARRPVNMPLVLPLPQARERNLPSTLQLQLLILLGRLYRQCQK